MTKLSIVLCFGFSFLSHTLNAYAERTFYEIRMADLPVGYVHYQIAQETNDLLIETTVLFSIGRAELNQEIRLVANTRLNADTLLPMEYHLSTSINGFTQSTIDTHFGKGIAMNQIIAAGQNFDSDIPMPDTTYLVDNNFRVDHYNVLLSQYDFEKRQSQSFQILTPLAIPQVPKTVTFQLRWIGGETLAVGNTVYQTDWFEGNSNGNLMEFWYDRKSRRIVKWAIPSRQTEVMLSDSSVAGSKIRLETGIDALLNDSRLPRIKAQQDLGKSTELLALQARLDLHILASGETPTNPPNQWFEGKTERTENVVHINGILNVRILEPRKRMMGSTLIKHIYSDNVFLQPEVEIQSENTEIREKSREITTTTETTVEATNAIVHWITQEISYASKTVSAQECLANKSGDALSTSRLVVALLRSLQIPARILGGLLYTSNGIFVQHHWVEVYVESYGDWISIDALTGETERLSAAHLALWQNQGQWLPDSDTTKMQVLDFQSAAIAWQDLIPLQIDERNHFTLTLNGRHIGSEQNHVKAILTYKGIKCYEIEGTSEINHDDFGRVSVVSTMYLSLDGRPLYYQSDLDIDGKKTSYEYTRDGTRLQCRQGDEFSEMWIDKNTSFIGNRMFWHWDLLFRKKELFTGMNWVTVALDPERGTLNSVEILVEDAEEMTVQGKQFSCFRLSIDGQRLWVSSVGRLIRWEQSETGLVVELEVRPVSTQ